MNEEEKEEEEEEEEEEEVEEQAFSSPPPTPSFLQFTGTPSLFHYPHTIPHTIPQRRGRGRRREETNREVVGTDGLRGISVHVNIFMSKQTPAVETCHCSYSKETAYWNTPSLLPFSIA